MEHGRDAIAIHKLKQGDARPRGGREQGELGREWASLLDDPTEGQPPGLPCWVLADRADDGKDGIGPRLGLDPARPGGV